MSDPFQARIGQFAGMFYSWPAEVRAEYNATRARLHAERLRQEEPYETPAGWNAQIAGDKPPRIEGE